ncbi:MAG: M14 family metallopeptidase [Lachnospiraceae bacterium]|nr:M14 family metallopeptidase [Lachnospiraceae bacterium]
MRRESIFTLKNLYRDDLNVYGYHFGKGEKSACIIGAMRGNEVQQMYVCSQLVKALGELEAKGAIVHDNEILVIPSVNHGSMNIGKRFWPGDNTDINRMFPGYDKGETTQRVADGVFQVVQHYNYGIQFTSFYMPGDFVPHVRMMETGYQNASLANLFGMPYVVIRKPRPYDTTTLNYNWQVWNTNAFSVYTSATDTIDEMSAKQAVSSVLRFLTRMGILRYTSHSGFISTVLREDDLMNVKTDVSGIYKRHVNPGDEVFRGEVVASIIDPCEGNVMEQILSPTDGIVFFAHRAPLIMEEALAFRIIRRLHQ